MAEFQTAFEDLKNKVTGISEPLLISFFITGLKTHIRWELLFSRPSSLMEVFALARAYEARSTESFPLGIHSKWSRSSGLLSHSAPPANNLSAPVISPPDQVITTSSHRPPPLANSKMPALFSGQPLLLPTPDLPIRHMNASELREEREKGQCYNCDQKYSPLAD